MHTVAHEQVSGGGSVVTPSLCLYSTAGGPAEVGILLIIMDHYYTAQFSIRLWPHYELHCGLVVGEL